MSARPATEAPTAMPAFAGVERPFDSVGDAVGVASGSVGVGAAGMTDGGTTEDVGVVDGWEDEDEEDAGDAEEAFRSAARASPKSGKTDS